MTSYEKCLGNSGIQNAVLYYSMVLYNEWIIIRAMLSDGTESQSAMTMLTFKMQLELHLMHEPKPPT